MCARARRTRDPRHAGRADGRRRDASVPSVDVRDAAAFGALVDALYARHGRLDGVIHGAGVIEDKLARDKTSESFARVFDTKVNGALAIAKHVRADVGFIVFFSSISATFGNRGQADYAAANDSLDRLAVTLKRRLPARVLSINWGPWARRRHGVARAHARVREARHRTDRPGRRRGELPGRVAASGPRTTRG